MPWKIGTILRDGNSAFLSQASKTMNKDTDLKKVQGLFGKQWRNLCELEHKGTNVWRVMSKDVEDGTLHKN